MILYNPQRLFLFFDKVKQISFWQLVLEGVRAKKVKATILFVNFSKAFDSIHR